MYRRSSLRVISTQNTSSSSMILSETDSKLSEYSSDPSDNNVQRRSRLVRINLPLLLSTSSIVLVMAGLGVVLLFWFAKHTIQPDLADVWREGAFLLDEGTRLEGGFETARLSGLTIASAVVCASSACAVCYTLTRKIKTRNRPSLRRQIP